MDHLCYFCLVFLCVHAHLFVDALWSPAGKWLSSWLSFVMSNGDVVTFSLVSWVRCGTWLYRFLIFALFRTLQENNLLILFVTFVSCHTVLWSPAWKGLTSWLSCIWCFLVFCLTVPWCPWSGVVFDCMGSWSSSPSLLCYLRNPLYHIEPVHEISNIVVCATSKASGQPANTRSLIIAFASRLNILWL